MWACLKPHTFDFTMPMYFSEQLFGGGFNDRVQSGFSPSNSASIFVLYSENVRSLRLDVLVSCRHTTSTLARREKSVAGTKSIALH